MIYLELFFEFFKIGLFTFGGGYAMIPLVKELVISKSWLSEELFYDFIGVCESTPGPIAINMATFVGSTQGGLLGSILATLGVVLPSFIIIILVATILTKFTNNKHFKNFLQGIKPIIVALITSTGLILLAKAIGYNSNFEFAINDLSIGIFAGICLIYSIYKIVFKKKINTILLILISALLGVVVSYLS